MVATDAHAEPSDVAPASCAELGDEEAGASEEVEWRALAVGAAQHGQRLDRMLAEAVAEFSRSYLQQLIEQGAVSLHGKPVLKPAHKVKVGDLLRLEMRPTLESQAFRPEPMALQVVYEDAHLLVIDKPAGLVVHPAPGNWGGTLLNGLLAYSPACTRVPRAGIVHRLDKDTSGLMVVAKTRSTMDALVGMIGRREVQRQYQALAHRPWQGREQVSVEMPIGRDPRNRLRMAVVDLAQHAGKPARTDVELLASNEEVCWVRCTLHTGRTHQIRVHVAHLGHPLVADVLYGGHPALGLERQALHAFRLAFSHPVQSTALEFHAPLPTDMRQALAAAGLGYNLPH